MTPPPRRPDETGVPVAEEVIDLRTRTPEPRHDSVRPPASLPTGSRLHTAEPSQISAALQLEYEVFLEEEYCQPSEHCRVEEFDPWSDRSRFRIVQAASGEIQGVVRTLLGDYAELPVGSFTRWTDFPADPVLEYASLAVRREHRRAGIAEALYRGVWQDAICSGASGLVAIGADWLLDILNGTYHFGFRQIGPGRDYMGGPCIPVGASVVEIVERFTRQPTFLRWATEEVELDDIADPAIRDAVAAARTAAAEGPPTR